MRRLALLAAAAMVAASATPVLAGPPMEVSGDWTYFPGVPTVEKMAGNNLFLSNDDVGTWTGGLEGTSTEDFTVAIHKGHGNYKGVVTFTGEVDGREGTLTIKTNGTGPWPPFGPWSGHWVIISGTGELSNLRGNGTWSGPLTDLDYAGKVKFTGK